MFDIVNLLTYIIDNKTVSTNPNSVQKPTELDQFKTSFFVRSADN